MPVCMLMKVLKSSKALITMAAFVRSFACNEKRKWSHYFPNHLPGFMPSKIAQLDCLFSKKIHRAQQVETSLSISGKNRVFSSNHKATQATADNKTLRRHDA